MPAFSALLLCLQIVDDAVSILDGISDWSEDVVQEESSGYLLVCVKWPTL